MRTLGDSEQTSLFDNDTAPVAPNSFKKAVPILHSMPLTPLNLLERAMTNVWLKNALDTPSNNGWWEITHSTFQRVLDRNFNKNSYIVEIATKLQEIAYEWNVMGDKSGSPRSRIVLKRSVLFPEVEITDTGVRYQISSEIQKHLLSPEIYAWIDLNVMRKFTRLATLGLWEFCVRYEKVGKTTPVPWRKLRDMILGDSSELPTYAEYKHFKAKALNPAIKEINEKSEHRISLREEKHGTRAVHEVWFTIEIPQQAKERIDDQLVADLVSLGFRQSQAIGIVSKHGKPHISAALDYTRKRQSNPSLVPLTHPDAYFRNALEQGYSDGSVQALSKPDHVGASTTTQEVDLRGMYVAEQITDARGLFRELDVTEQADLMSRYNEQQSVAALKLKPQSKAKPSKVAETAFLQWLAETTWGEPTPDELLRFAARALAKQQEAQEGKGTTGR